jgi:hypothetical protein
MSARHSKMKSSRLSVGRSVSSQAGSTTNTRGDSGWAAAAGLAAESESSVSQTSGRTAAAATPDPIGGGQAAAGRIRSGVLRSSPAAGRKSRAASRS